MTTFSVNKLQVNGAVQPMIQGTSDFIPLGVSTLGLTFLPEYTFPPAVTLFHYDNRGTLIEIVNPTSLTISGTTVNITTSGTDDTYVWYAIGI